MHSASESDLDFKMDVRHCEALLIIADLMVHHEIVREHLRKLVEMLNTIVAFEAALPVLLHDT